MNKLYVDEGRGPEMSEVIGEHFKAASGNVPLYFYHYEIDDVYWIISTEPITDEMIKYHYENWVGLV